MADKTTTDHDSTCAKVRCCMADAETCRQKCTCRTPTGPKRLNPGDRVTMHGGSNYGIVDAVDEKGNVTVTYTRVRTFVFKAGELVSAR